MNSQDKQWWIAQAGEYVLGTLSDSEWKTFKKALQYDKSARQLVADWEETFQPLADSLAPVSPSSHVWFLIKKRISAALAKQSSGSSDSIDTNNLSSLIDDNLVLLDEQRSIAKSLKKNADRWRTYSGLATAASLLLASLAWFNYSNQDSQKPQATVVAVSQFDAITIIRDEQSMPLWVVDTALEEGWVRVTAVAPPSIDETNVYQLWLVKPDNAGVQSMGLIPQSSDESVILPVVAESISPIAFAVSLEPAGGSTQAGPTGPVLYQGAIQILKL